MTYSGRKLRLSERKERNFFSERKQLGRVAAKLRFSERIERNIFPERKQLGRIAAKRSATKETLA